jgi:hypothetical protein
MTGSRIDSPIREDLIARASQRTDWAGRALQKAADDLADAGSGDGALEGLAEGVAFQAGVVSRMAEDIGSRKRIAFAGRRVRHDATPGSPCPARGNLELSTSAR